MPEKQEPTLYEKVRFLCGAAAYPASAGEVVSRETHMSWVFLAGDKAYKLKKPVKLRYLDFSTLERRKAACLSEIILNRRLAPDVYLGVQPLVLSSCGLALGGPGTVVDWLVVMRRLDERDNLENAILNGWLKVTHVERLASKLVKFYRRAKRIYVSPAAELLEWRRSLLFNRRILLNPRLGLPAAQIRFLDSIQRQFLGRCSELIVERVHKRRILDAHGDLRPEHIWLTDDLKIIDCLEFNPRLRAVDVFDEIAYLTLECERLGAAWAGEYVYRTLTRALHDEPPQEVFLFYRCHRATLRASLAIAHLLEPNPRTPEKWPRAAKAYLNSAVRNASELETLIKRRQAARLRLDGSRGEPARHVMNRRPVLSFVGRYG